MPEIMRSKSQAFLADLHKPAPLKNPPSHYDLLLITRVMASSPLLQPRTDVVRVTHGGHDTQRGADERARHLGNLS